MTQVKKKTAPLVAALSVLLSAVVVGGAWGGVFGVGVPLLAGEHIKVVEQQMIGDALGQLKTAVDAKRDPMQICMYAQMVSTAMIQAKDSAALANFMPTERRFCDAAGMP